MAHKKTAAARKSNTHYGSGQAWFLRSGPSWEFADRDEVFITPADNASIVDRHHTLWGRIGHLYGGGIAQRTHEGKYQSVAPVDLDGTVVDVPITMILPLKRLAASQQAELRDLSGSIARGEVAMFGDGRIVTPEAGRKYHARITGSPWVVGRSARAPKRNARGGATRAARSAGHIVSRTVAAAFKQAGFALVAQGGNVFSYERAGTGGRRTYVVAQSDNNPPERLDEAVSVVREGADGAVVSEKTFPTLSAALRSLRPRRAPRAR